MTRPNRSRAGVLLVNVGTPDAPSTADVRRYLGEFLMDPRVIDLPLVARWLLVHGIILRTRPRRSAAAYRQIWTGEGSPLLLHGQALAAGLQETLGDEVASVELAMRYRHPDPDSALRRLMRAGAEEIVVVPLYPQYSESAWASAFDAVSRAASEAPRVPGLRFVPPFWEQSEFLDAVAEVARPVLDGFGPDRVLMSFHGLPESHVRRTDATGGQHCLARPDCCQTVVDANRYCYRAQCLATARSLADRLGLAPDDYEVTFQSRLTRRWIRPFTDERLRALPAEGVRRLAVLCPAFVADCLETLEEIGMRAAATFESAGGEALCAVPCVNSHPAWVRGLAAIVRRHLPSKAGVPEPPEHALAPRGAASS